MSNALAIAAVTETIVSLVTSGLDAALVTGAQVTALPPDASGLPNPGVNIFLYQVAPNKAYRNADLPTRNASGNLLKKPLAALDLYYLFTFYGDATAREQERLLGAVALALQANPTLPRSLVQSVQSSTSFLTTSTLDAQAELIRFTPIVFSLEELSKLWSFLLKVDYVLSTAYVASVVLIETDDAVPGPALPVLSYSVTAQPIATPVINAVSASPDPTQPILAGSVIAITGQNLAAPAGSSTQILLNGAPVTSNPPAAQTITLTLPGSLAAGAQTLQVAQPLALGNPPVAHPGTGPISVIYPFTLLPQVTAASQAGGSVSITINPQVQAGQRVILMLTAQAAPNAVRLFDGGTQSAAVSNLAIPVSGLTAGNYTTQVLVDNAESPAGPTVLL